MDKDFSLVDEPCVPCVDGNWSLNDVFTGRGDMIRGDSRTVNSLLNLLSAIGVAALARKLGKDESWPDGWDGLERLCGGENFSEVVAGFGKIVREYLEENKKLFYLYGERPFLQFPDIMKIGTVKLVKENGIERLVRMNGAERLAKDCNHAFRDISRNGAIISRAQRARKFGDLEKFLLVVRMGGAALGGKCVLKAEYKGVPGTDVMPGAPLMQGSTGTMNFRLCGQSVLETVWLSIPTNTVLKRCGIDGIGDAAWERMPESSVDETARKMRRSLLGRLVPMSCFCLLERDGNRIYRAQGIRHVVFATWKDVEKMEESKDPNTKKKGAKLKKSIEEGDAGVFFDPAMALRVYKDGAPELIRADPRRKPWRWMPAMLGAARIAGRDIISPLAESALEYLMSKSGKSGPGMFGFWCGGLSVSFDNGQQSMKAGDRDIQSFYELTLKNLDDKWFSALDLAFRKLDGIAWRLGRSVMKYWSGASEDGGKGDEIEAAESVEAGENGKDGKEGFCASVKRKAAVCEDLFWSEMDRLAPDFLKGGGQEFERAVSAIYAVALDIYNRFCRPVTPAQFALWGRYRPCGEGGDIMEKEKTVKKSESRRISEAFTGWVLEKINDRDGAFVREMRCAGDPDTGPRAIKWVMIASRELGEEVLRKRGWREACLLAASLMCRLKVTEDGQNSLGTALSIACRKNEDKGDRRMLRLLLCHDFGDLESYIPRLASLASDRDASLCFASLLDDLQWAAGGSSRSMEILKKKWASDFYAKAYAEGDGDD